TMAAMSRTSSVTRRRSSPRSTTRRPLKSYSMKSCSSFTTRSSRRSSHAARNPPRRHAAPSPRRRFSQQQSRYLGLGRSELLANLSLLHPAQRHPTHHLNIRSTEPRASQRNPLGPILDENHKIGVGVEEPLALHVQRPGDVAGLNVVQQRRPRRPQDSRDLGH